MTKKNDSASIVNGVVAKFKANWVLYRSVAELLEKHILPELFPDAQKVSARSKEPASIAGKVLKKYIQLGNVDEIYKKFTDLVGARVIFLRRDQVEAADTKIRDFFIVDDHNSQNTAERLNDREFGYQSRHYIVRIDNMWMEKKASPLLLKKDGGEKITLKERLGTPIFIELQVRTWLQHVWADLSHDSIYKGDRVIPRELMRSWNALAAILENVDEDIVRCLDQLEQYRKNSAYNIAEEVDKKIETMKIIVGVQLDCSSGSLTEKERHHLTRSCDELLRLQKIKQDGDESLRSLIDKIEKRLGKSTSPKEDLTNPKDLLDFLSTAAWINCGDKEKNYNEKMLVPLLNMALDRCESMIRSNSELPWAFAGKAFFNMLLFEKEMIEEKYKKEEKSKKERVRKIYDSILRLIDLCNERSVANLDRERRIATPDSRNALKKLKGIFNNASCFRDIPFQDGQAPVWRCALKMLELGCYTHGINMSNPKNGQNDPRVIIAGGCDSLKNTEALANFKSFFSAALEGNTKIYFYTGAGNEGICSLEFGPKNVVTRFGCKKDVGANVICSEYDKHSVWEALLTWDNLQKKTYRFDDIALVGFGLSEISSWECRIALAFGARVTVIGHKDFLSYEQTFEGIPYWSNHPNLVRLPLIRNRNPQNASFTKSKNETISMFRSYGFPEPMMLRVFMLFKPYHKEDYMLNNENNDLSLLIHRIKYLKTFYSPMRPDLIDINKDKRRSEQHRLLSFIRLYHDAHNGEFRKDSPESLWKRPSESVASLRTTDDIRRWVSEWEFSELALPDYEFGEREHARWYIERWLQGTRYGDNKIDRNVPSDQKRNPCMSAWYDLDDDTIRKDTDFISRYIIAEEIKAVPGAADLIAKCFSSSPSCNSEENT